MTTSSTPRLSSAAKAQFTLAYFGETAFGVNRQRVAYLLRAARSRCAGNIRRNALGYYVRDCRVTFTRSGQRVQPVHEIPTRRLYVLLEERGDASDTTPEEWEQIESNNYRVDLE